MAKDFFAEEIGSAPTATAPTKQDFFSQEIESTTPRLIQKFKDLSKTPPLMARVAEATRDAVVRKRDTGKFNLKPEDVLRVVSPELEAAGEVLPAVPAVIPFNVITNMAVEAQEGLDPKRLIKAGAEALPFGKLVKDVKERGPSAVLDRESLTEPLNLRRPGKLLLNVIKAINPDFKEPEGMLTNLVLDLAGSVLTGSPQAAAAKISQASSGVDALRALKTLKNLPERRARLVGKGIQRQLESQPKALPAPKTVVDEMPKAKADIKAARAARYAQENPDLYREVVELQTEAAGVQPAFNKALEDVAGELRISKKYVPTASGKTIRARSVGNTKSVDSLLSKVQRKRSSGAADYGPATPKDHVRGAIFLDNFRQAPAALERLRAKFPDLVIESTVERPLNHFGYRGINATTKLGKVNGEIQIHTADSWRLKMKSDKIYDRWRDLNEADFDRISPVVRKAYARDLKKSGKIWSDYWKGKTQDERAAISSGVKGLPSETAPSVKVPSGVQAPSLSTSGSLPSERGAVSTTLPSANFTRSMLPPSTKNISAGPAKVKANVLSPKQILLNQVEAAKVKLGAKSDIKVPFKFKMGGSTVQINPTQEALQEFEKRVTEGIKWRPDYRRAKGSTAALPQTRITKLDNELGQARFTKSFEGMSEDEIRAEVQRLLGKAAREGKKERKFITTVREAEKTTPEVKARVFGVYEPITNKGTLAAAQARIAKDADEALNYVRTIEHPTAESNATAIALIDKFQNAGNYQQAIDLVEDLAQKATKQGQAIQALSMYSRLTPEGVLRFAQRSIDKAKAARPGAKIGPLTPEVAKILREMSAKIAAAETPRQRAVETARLLKRVHQLVPSTFWQKVSMFQTMMQLLNPKTAIRNIAGNVGFAGIENISDTVAAAFDKATSLVTKQRTKMLPSLKVQARGAARGAKEAIEDIRAGIRTSAGATQFDLPQTGIFKSRVGQSLESLLRYELEVPDRMAFKATYRNSLLNQLKAAKASGQKIFKPTPEMVERATYDGLYRTFQDPNAISKGFSKIKSALNQFTGSKEFGIGDMALKYPKTPGAILARGIDYSPAGFIKTTLELARPLMGQAFNQKAFVESASRAFVGSTLVGTGILLAKLGLITGRKKDKPGIRELKRMIGLGDYKINISGLRRFVLSGLDPKEAALREGDTLATYDWFQPQAIDIAIGANIEENKGRPTGVVGTIADSVASGAKTLAEQPLVSGLQRLFGYGDIVGGLGELAKGIPASFTPTLLNHIRTLVDDIRRNPDSDSPAKEGLNLVKMRVPGLSGQVRERLEPLGGVSRIFKGERTPGGKAAETFLSPANISKYGGDKDLDVIKELIRLDVPVGTQGETLKGIELTENERFDIDKLIGPNARVLLRIVVRTPAYKKADDLQKQKILEAAVQKSKTSAQRQKAPAIARRLVGKQP